MLTNTKRIKVLLYGNNSCRNYRSNSLKIFSKTLIIAVLKFALVLQNKNTNKFFSTEKLFILLGWIELFIKAAFADLIYLLPMNVRFIKSALWAAKLFNKTSCRNVHITL